MYTDEWKDAVLGVMTALRELRVLGVSTLEVMDALESAALDSQENTLSPQLKVLHLEVLDSSVLNDISPSEFAIRLHRPLARRAERGLVLDNLPEATLQASSGNPLGPSAKLVQANDVNASSSSGASTSFKRPSSPRTSPNPLHHPASVSVLLQPDLMTLDLLNDRETNNRNPPGSLPLTPRAPSKIKTLRSLTPQAAANLMAESTQPVCPAVTRSPTLA
ncbi:uncharacterized protein PHACADRAFT_197310 [Phanerochaete carnosa HHB-10118-sp]|uniref:Uncharacterized protein n=1 Tax=Phanerochaete carnosa (strain HHB-10118-sp) TaxID=650164 RepID=K5WWQ2_PHACS|nr:uncharacterized protein PHACADRAFT_197310 [Phanerochaete carnosa HHB-10118-sp]EKM54877.1 hypothetical protein PHACADRAFT_197310 [Phanerochaete carnosa HHB-10118-sp]